MEQFNFSRTPEEMKENYENSIIYFGDKDPGTAGSEKGVRFTAFATSKLLANYLTEDQNFAKRLYDNGMKEIGSSEKIPDTGSPYFLELRYKSSEAVIAKMIEKFGPIQVVELASGFTPHGLSVTSKSPEVKKWIDNDFEASLAVKQKVVNDMVGGLPIEYVPGSVLEQGTWDKIDSRLIPGLPVVIFCEGLIMYFTKEEREKFYSFIHGVLDKHDGCFFHEDVLKYQKGNKVIEEGRSKDDFLCITQQIKEISGGQNNPALDEFYTQDEVTKEYEDSNFTIERVPERDIATLSFDKYPEEKEIKTPTIQHTLHPRQAGSDLLEANFKMWVLYPKSK